MPKNYDQPLSKYSAGLETGFGLVGFYRPGDCVPFLNHNNFGFLISFQTAEFYLAKHQEKCFVIALV